MDTVKRSTPRPLFFATCLALLLTLAGCDGNSDGNNDTTAPPALDTPEEIRAAIDDISTDPARLAALIDSLRANAIVSQDFVSRLAGEDSGRRLLMDELAGDTAARDGFSALLQEADYADLQAPLARNLVATPTGREAVMASLPSASPQLSEFAALLGDARYGDRSDEFATALAASANGPAAFLDALPAGSAALLNFSRLLTGSPYADRLSAFAVALMATESGQRALLDHGAPPYSGEWTDFSVLLRDTYPQRLTEMLQTAGQTDSGAGLIADSLLATPRGRTATAGNMLAQYARMEDVVGQILAAPAGRTATLSSLRPGSTALTEFSSLLTDTAYADRLSAFASAMTVTEQGQRALLEYGLPLNSADLNDFAALLRDSYADWLTQILETVTTTDAGADLVAAPLLATNRGRAAAVRDLLTDYPRLLEVVGTILNAQDGRRATMESFDNGDPADVAAEARRNQFSNIDWLNLGHSPATVGDWVTHYPYFTTLMQSRIC